MSTELSSCMQDLLQSGFKIRGIVTDNHSANVAAFKILLNENPGDKKNYLKLPSANYRTFVFFDSVHLIKNIRNNLLSAKRFVFPGFDFNVCGMKISSSPGYISWHDIHNIHDKDQKLQANLRKAPKLSYHALHPGNNKQNVNLALGIFHETTIAACKSYYPAREDMANFLNLILTWWTISNSNKKYDANPLGNAITGNDDKLDFFDKFADWLEAWAHCPNYCLSKQTANALVLTLRSHAMLIRELIAEGYDHVMTRRLQSDPIENRFSQYRQMSGGRFLVSLREVQSSERILVCRSLLKIGVDFWTHDDINDDESENLNVFMTQLIKHETEILEVFLSDDSTEVAHCIAGYVAKKILYKSKCEECVSLMLNKDPDVDAANYLNLLSRGGLIHPSDGLSFFISTLFAQIDFINKLISSTSVKKYCQFALEKYAPQSVFSCNIHSDRNREIAIKIIINVFYNNMQKLAKGNVRKHAVNEFKKRQRTKEN